MKPGTPASRRPPPGAGRLKAVAVALLVVDMLLLGAERYASGSVLIPELIGTLLSPIIITAVVVGVARLFKRAKTPRGTAKVAIGTLLVVAMASCGGLLSAVTATPAEAAPAARVAMLSAAAAANTLPRQVDSVTSLRDVKAVGDTLVYSYRMSNITAAALEQSSADAFRAQLIARACSSAPLRSDYLSHGVIVRYHYADVQDKELATVDVTESVCSRAK